MKFLHRFQSNNNTNPTFHSKISEHVLILFYFAILASTGLTAVAKEIKCPYYWSLLVMLVPTLSAWLPNYMIK